MTDHDPPKPSRGDASHLLARAAISAIPLIGGPGLELFNAVVAPPLERRRGEWMQQVGNALKKLGEARDIDVARLSEIGSFVDTALHASTIAVRTSDPAKRSALAAAVLNSALPEAPDVAEQHLFVQMVDEFTSWHLRVLWFFARSSAATELRKQVAPTLTMGAPAHLLISHYPELGRRDEFTRQIWRDLYVRGLVTSDTLNAIGTEAGIRAARSSPFGERFLAFVTSPVEET